MLKVCFLVSVFPFYCLCIYCSDVENTTYTQDMIVQSLQDQEHSPYGYFFSPDHYSVLRLGWLLAGFTDMATPYCGNIQKIWTVYNANEQLGYHA